jgi:tripartite-type tricarboxylate transporter receptor subunit TctC
MLAWACAAASDPAAERPYPSKPVHLVVPFAPGGPADHVARALAPPLERLLGQPVVVENKLGADGALATQAVARAAADGHTLLLSSASLVPLGLMRKAPPFDLQADFAPVSKLTPALWAMYVTPQIPARSVAEFIAHARENPGRLHYASSTMVDFMAAERFMKASGLSLVKVPYKGATQAMPDLVTGRVQVNFSPVSVAALEQVKAGKLRILAVLSPQRSPVAPDVPTMDEAGVHGVSVPGWLAVVAPAGTPKPVVDRLHGAIASTLDDPQVRALLARQSMQAEGSTPEALAALIDQDLRTWRDFIRENGLTPE